MSSQRRIVVGVEGSGGARAALRWAIDEARFREAMIDVVTTYVATYVPAAPDLGFVPLDPIDLVAEVEKLQNEVVASVTEHCDVSDIEIQQRLVKGRAAETLIEAADGADMLVVGNRGRGGFRGLLLGSVSHQIAHHATCPVVIVRAELLPEDEDGGGREEAASD